MQHILHDLAVTIEAICLWEEKNNFHWCWLVVFVDCEAAECMLFRFLLEWSGWFFRNGVAVIAVDIYDA